MPALRRRSGDTRKFYGHRRIRLYPDDRLYEEAAFIGYYFHWSREEILQLSHLERVRWCDEISKINRKTNGASKKKSDNPFSLDEFM